MVVRNLLLADAHGREHGEVVAEGEVDGRVFLEELEDGNLLNGDFLVVGLAGELEKSILGVLVVGGFSQSLNVLSCVSL